MKELFTLYYHRRILFTDFFSQSLGGIDDQSNYDQLMKQIQSVLDQK